MFVPRETQVLQTDCIMAGNSECYARCRVINELEAIGYYRDGYDGRPMYDPTTEPSFVRSDTNHPLERVHRDQFNSRTPEERITAIVHDEQRLRLGRADVLGCLKPGEVAVWVETRIRQGKSS